MKIKMMTISYQVFLSPETLPDSDARLLEQARRALDFAYAPYSRFRVGAAVLLENGEIVCGSNQENAAYPMCLCAERTAIAVATASYPDIPVKAIAVSVKNPDLVINQPAAPCGACRQVICEMEDRFGQSIVVLLQGEEGDIFKFGSGKDLLPLAFNASYLGSGLEG